MAKYHVNPNTGEAKTCSAQVQCRFGEDAEHFDNVKDARVAAEQYLGEKYGTAAVSKTDDPKLKKDLEDIQSWDMDSAGKILISEAAHGFAEQRAMENRVNGGAAPKKQTQEFFEFSGEEAKSVLDGVYSVEKVEKRGNEVVFWYDPNRREIDEDYDIDAEVIRIDGWEPNHEHWMNIFAPHADEFEEDQLRESAEEVGLKTDSNTTFSFGTLREYEPLTNFENTEW